MVPIRIVAAVVPPSAVSRRGAFGWLGLNPSQRRRQQAIITQVAGANVSCKAVWLLQLLRPALRSAVTAPLLSPMKTAAAEERRADFLGAPRLWLGIAQRKCRTFVATSAEYPGV